MVYVSTACFHAKKIKDAIHLLAQKNIKNIELSGGTDYYDGIEDDLIKLKRTYQLTYACHAYFPPPKTHFVVNLASCNDVIYQQSIEHYENCIRLLKNMDCKVLSIHAGFLVEVGTEEIGHQLNNRIIYDEKKAYDRFCSAYCHISKECKKNGINIYLENNVLSKENYERFESNNYMMMTDYSSICKMKTQIDFDLLLDLGHLFVSTNTLHLNYENECKKLSQLARWFHISDNNGICDEHKPLTMNSKIFQTYGQLACSDINVTLETNGTIDEVCKSQKMIQCLWS